MKPALIQEKKNPCIKHLPFKERSIYSIENWTYDQEAHPSTTTLSKLKGGSHHAEMTSNPISSRESTSESSSFPQADSAIKDVSVILEKRVDEILHIESKTSTKVFETESKDRKTKPSLDLTSKPDAFEPNNFDSLEEPFYLDYSK